MQLLAYFFVIAFSIRTSLATKKDQECLHKVRKNICTPYGEEIDPIQLVVFVNHW